MIALESIAPGEKVRRWLARMPVTPYYGPEQAIADMESGRTQVIGVRVDGKPSAVLLLGRAGNDLDVIALAGELGGRDGMPELVGQLRQIATDNGLSGVSCRTSRRGLVRRLERIGWQQAETIMRIGGHGRQ